MHSGPVAQGGLCKENLLSEYRRWLCLLNYSTGVVRYDPGRVAEFLDYLKARKIMSLDEISSRDVEHFFEQLSKRKNRQTGKLLKLAGLRTYRSSLRRFARFVRQSEGINIEVSVRITGSDAAPIAVLKKEEIDRLYGTCEDTPLGIRDRAMLAVCYGCGARRNEAAKLKVSHVLTDASLLYIKHGKGYRERYVPMVKGVKRDLLLYKNIGRPLLLNGLQSEAFFIGRTADPIGASGLYERFKRLLKKAGIHKKAGLHSLRHSVATHLHQGGMSLAEIATFLGHASLESTQIYTHLSTLER